MYQRIITLIALSALRLFPQSPEVSLQSYFEQGEKALAEGRYQDAEATYTRLKSLAPKVAEVYGRLGLVYFEERRYEEAIPAFRRALKLKPSLPNTDVLLAASLSELGHYSEALPTLEKSFHHLSDPELKRMSGLQLERTYTGLRRDSDAVQTALELSRLYPDDPEILYHSARLFGNFAFLSMQKLSEVAPDSVWRHEAAGDAFQSEGKYELAAAEFRHIIAQSPNRPGIHYRLGRTLLALPESHAGAAHEFTQELAIDPSNANAAYELAEIHRKAGELEKARDLFMDAIHSYPDFEDANVGLGRSLLGLGKPEAALVYLKKATSLDPQDETAYYHLALAYKSLGKSSEQRSALDKFQQLRDQASRHSDALHAAPAVTKQDLDPAPTP